MVRGWERSWRKYDMFALFLWLFPGHLLFDSCQREHAGRDGEIQENLSQVLVILVELRQNNLPVN